jgi:hypothetical protein
MSSGTGKNKTMARLFLKVSGIQVKKIKIGLIRRILLRSLN